AARDAVMRELRSSFRPEFLNRVDEIVLFKPLSKSEIKSIVRLLVQELGRRLDDRDITLQLSEAALDYIADTGYDPAFGARPLKRFLQRKLETKIGRAIIAGEVADGSVIEVDSSGTDLELKVTAGGNAADRLRSAA
ncbi:MAG: ATP-dependent chaperone ClpB, partial [Bdellovibrionales bacterium]|nr:ATP-dependent chaperone ClpB [Bdellovibrionales bacterium]